MKKGIPLYQMITIQLNPRKCRDAFTKTNTLKDLYGNIRRRPKNKSKKNIYKIAHKKQNFCVNNIRTTLDSYLKNRTGNIVYTWEVIIMSMRFIIIR